MRPPDIRNVRAAEIIFSVHSPFSKVRMGRGVRYGCRFDFQSETDGTDGARGAEGQKGGPRLRARFAFCVMAEEICVASMCLRESSRAHAAAPAHIRIVMATSPVVCRVRRDLAARRTYVDDRGRTPR